MSAAVIIKQMAAEVKKEIELEIGHVLFIDIVGYSKLLIDEQRDYLHTLNEVVRRTDSFRAADAAGKLTRLPTGPDSAACRATCSPGPAFAKAGMPALSSSTFASRCETRRIASPTSTPGRAASCIWSALTTACSG